MCNKIHLNLNLFGPKFMYVAISGCSAFGLETYIWNYTKLF